MKKNTRTPVANSVLLVMDQAIGIIPESMNGRLIATSPSCIAVGTASESDELVEIELTDVSPDVDEEMRCVGKSRIQTPNREIAVCSVFDEKYLTLEVHDEVSEVEVWANHPTEPDRVVVVVRSANHS